MSQTGETRLLTRRASTLVSLAAASLLVVLKLGVGLASGSLGLISSGIESSGDVIAAALTFFAVKLGGRPADFEHPYGHRRAENLGALGEAAILLGGGVLVSVEAITRLSGKGTVPSVHWYELAVIGVALLLEVGRMSISLAPRGAPAAPRCAPTWRTSPRTWRARWRCSPACWRCTRGSKTATRWRRCWWRS